MQGKPTVKSKPKGGQRNRFKYQEMVDDEEYAEVYPDQYDQADQDQRQDRR